MIESKIFERRVGLSVESAELGIVEFESEPEIVLHFDLDLRMFYFGHGHHFLYFLYFLDVDSVLYVFHALHGLYEVVHDVEGSSRVQVESYGQFHVVCLNWDVYYG